MKTYLINIIILIKCIDIITSMTSGTIGAFILSEGFRNKIVYNLGLYKWFSNLHIAFIKI